MKHNDETVEKVLWGELTKNEADVVIGGRVRKVRITELEPEPERAIIAILELRRSMIESLDHLLPSLANSKKAAESLKTAIQNCNYTLLMDTRKVLNYFKELKHEANEQELIMLWEMLDSYSLTEIEA